MYFMNDINPITLWVIVIVVLFILVSFFRLFFRKKNPQPVNAQNQLLQRRTQGRLGRDERLKHDIMRQLENTKDERQRAELLKKFQNIARDEESTARRGR